MPDTPTNDLLLHMNSIHTTEMGVERILKTLFLP